MSQGRARWLAVSALLCGLSVSSGATAQQPQVLTFVADLKGTFVAPKAVETRAVAKATAVLVGNRFSVHGSFSNLSSPLRDIVAKPDDPGVHLHRGAPGETTPYFHGLQVRLNADERSGIFFGTATLDASQLDMLLSGRSYVDIHTVTFGPGEVRDQWRPLDPRAAEAVRAALPREWPAPESGASAGACHR